MTFALGITVGKAGVCTIGQHLAHPCLRLSGGFKHRSYICDCCVKLSFSGLNRRVQCLSHSSSLVVVGIAKTNEDPERFLDASRYVHYLRATDLVEHIFLERN